MDIVDSSYMALTPKATFDLTVLCDVLSSEKIIIKASL